MDPAEWKILLTDPPLNPAKNRETMVDINFAYNLSLEFTYKIC